jgi:hypothetical protein
MAGPSLTPKPLSYYVIYNHYKIYSYNHYNIYSYCETYQTLEAIDELEEPVAGVVATLLNIRGVVESDDVAVAARPCAWRLLRY